MATIEAPVDNELLRATDAEIEDAVKYADPMVLRGLLHQLTGDKELETIALATVPMAYFMMDMPAGEEETAKIQRKAADFLKAHRDAGAPVLDIGPRERLHRSLELIYAEPLTDQAAEFYIEEMGLDHWVRALAWKGKPDPAKLKDFTVTIIGAGLGGLNVAAMLDKAGICWTLVEKNDGVGGTWWENRYPGARVDTPSRSYNHVFGVEYDYPSPFCDWKDNQLYFEWVADRHDLRRGIRFNTEVRALTWNEADRMWDIDVTGPDGEQTLRSNAVFTAVGFLSRPNMPEIEGMESFAGPSWHTARWPEDYDLKGKRIAVIGTGATGYQMVPELALQAEQVTVFQRSPQWVFPIPGYRSPFPAQVGWLDRNLPFHRNFMRARSGYTGSFPKLTTIDPDYDDPHACNALNKASRDAAIGFLREKLGDEERVAQMTPPHPVWSARAIIVDPEYSILDALNRDNVELVTSGIARINPTGIEDADGTQHDVDAIVYATGFHASEYLYPMTVTGRNGQTIDQLWEDGGARAFLGCMMPGFPNLWSLYGPNTNGPLLVSSFHEMITLYALQCIERLLSGEEDTIDVTDEAYRRYNRDLDAENLRKVWSDPRTQSYYWTRHGRSAVQNPYSAPDMWQMLCEPDFADHDLR
jgi:4-hydroxyacetophenone monooxygenase